MSEGSEGDGGNLQNEFFNLARRNRSRVLIFLTTGRRLVGRIKSFDRFTLVLDDGSVEQIVYKHAIATVSAGGSRREREPRSAPAEGRPDESGGAQGPAQG